MRLGNIPRYEPSLEYLEGRKRAGEVVIPLSPVCVAMVEIPIATTNYHHLLPTSITESTRVSNTVHQGEVLPSWWGRTEQLSIMKQAEMIPVLNNEVFLVHRVHFL